MIPFFLNLANAQGADLLSDLDLPLMAGLTENQDAALLFDSPEGRIINAEANGNIKTADITFYYNGVLPSLGWNIYSGDCETGAVECIIAERENENLALNLFNKNGLARITYTLSPK
ncbi:hypothetical protein [Pseudemcibacter aquimaris]|uniref:hypothetical protein n=1 Tax=Pseudemcibacter aquimaris TaxID=2857064 RepID=UPI002012F857|nr:hypothetical protein [Pseudemcibacter aquimaris]MCC3861898.1 hypothetical protein [Pseudemcibacter aquimaris]WDU58650.1 hypothetical protein KW060_15825 [Pseudemcibacter aquimaris]